MATINEETTVEQLIAMLTTKVHINEDFQFKAKNVYKKKKRPSKTFFDPATHKPNRQRLRDLKEDRHDAHGLFSFPRVDQASDDLHQLTNAFSQVGDLASYLKDGLAKFFGEGQWMNMVAFIGLELESLVANFSPIRLAISIIKSLLFLGFDCVRVCKYIYQCVARQLTRAVHLFMAPPDEGHVTHGLFDALNGLPEGDGLLAMSGVLSGAIVLISGLTLGNKVGSEIRDNAQTVDQLAKKLRNLKSIGTGVEYLFKLTDQLKGLVEWTLRRLLSNKVESKFELLLEDMCEEALSSGEQSDKDFVEAYKRAKESLFGDLMRVLSVDSYPEIRTNRVWYNKFKDLYAIFCRVQLKLAEGTDPSMAGFCRTMYESLGRVDKQVANSPFSSMIRPTPFWLYLFGETRLGKSAAIPAMTTYLLHHLHIRFPEYFPSDNVEESVAVLQTGTLYMDNYLGQPICQIDDIFQKRDTVNGDLSEALRLIDFVTMTKTPIIAAAIENKFRPFEGKLILSTANVYAPALKSVAEPEAVYQRRAMVWKIVKSDNIDELLSLSGAERKVCFHRYAAVGETRLDNINYSYKQVLETTRDEFIRFFEAQLKVVKMVTNRSEILRVVDGVVSPANSSDRDLIDFSTESVAHGLIESPVGGYVCNGHRDYLMNSYSAQDEMLEWFFILYRKRLGLEIFQRDIHTWWDTGDYVAVPCVDVGYGHDNKFADIVQIRISDLGNMANMYLRYLATYGYLDFVDRFDCSCAVDDPYLLIRDTSYGCVARALVKRFIQYEGIPTGGEFSMYLRNLPLQGFGKPRARFMNVQIVHIEDAFPGFEQPSDQHEAHGFFSAIWNGVKETFGRDGNYIDVFLLINKYGKYVDRVDGSLAIDYGAIHVEDRDSFHKLMRAYAQHGGRLRFSETEVEFEGGVLLKVQELFTGYNLKTRAQVSRDWIVRCIKENKIILTALSAAALIGFSLKQWYKQRRSGHKAQALKYVSKTIPAKRIPVYSYNKAHGFVEEEEEAEFFNEVDRCYVRNNEDNATYDLIKYRFFAKHAMVTVRYNGYNLQATRIGGNYLLVPKHFFMFSKSRGLVDGEKFDVIEGLHLNEQDLSKRTYVQIFDSKSLRMSKTQDMCIYKVANMNFAASMLNQFPKKSVCVEVTNCVVPFLFPTTMLMVNLSAKPVGRQTYTLHLPKGGREEIVAPIAYHINMTSRPGMCGALALRIDNTIQPKILGMHVAGLPSGGEATYIPIYHEDVMDLLNQFDTDPLLDFVEEECTTNVHSAHGVYVEPLQYCAKLVNKSDYCIPQTKTKIKPSVIHDPSRCVTEPAVLNPKDNRLNEELRGRPLLMDNMQGYNIEPGAINMRTLKIVESAYAAEFQVVLDNVEHKRVLTLDESINGITGSYKALEMSTSPGFRYKKMFPNAKGKRACFVNRPDSDHVLDPIQQVSEDYYKCLGQMRQGIRPWMPAYACLKDERRKTQKIKEGVTRTFIVMDLIYTLITRSLFGAFVMAQQAKAGEIPSSVGLDSTTQFAKLWRRLTAVGNKAEDYDYKNWDRTLNPEFIRSYGRVVNQWYGDAPDSPDAIARTVLLEMLIYTDIIIGDKIYRKHIGICSGCAITAEINCVIHTMLVYYQFIEVAKRTGNSHLVNFTYFRDNVSCCVYGDDIVMMRSDEVDWFNGSNIAVVCDELGMTITPADKGAIVFRTKTLEECQFLKRGFVMDKETGAVSAPLELQVVNEIAEWIHESSNDAAATQANIETAVRETFYHGKETFSRTIKSFNERIKMYNLSNPGCPRLEAVVMDYDQLRLEWLEQGSPLSLMESFR